MQENVFHDCIMPLCKKPASHYKIREILPYIASCWTDNPEASILWCMEITETLQLSQEEQNLLAMHSALNVLNVILFELYSLRNTYGNHPSAETIEMRLHKAAESLSDSTASGALMKNIEDFIGQGIDLLQDWQKDLASQGKSMTEFDQSMDNLESIFDILRVRARELAARINDPDAWVVFPINELLHNYLNVFMAIEKNSKGRYRIVYNLAEHDEAAYLVNLNITSHNGKSVKMPAVMQDILRDLLANARKYTKPGGRIEAGLYDSGTELRLAVSDSGHGIPTEEIPKVVHFGERSSNACAPTRGGGFGLTKAYFYTKHFGGRMYIESELERGTQIFIHLPYTAHENN